MKTLFYHVVSNCYDKPQVPKAIHRAASYQTIAGSCVAEAGVFFNRFYKILQTPDICPISIYMDANIGLAGSSVEIAEWAEEQLKDADIAICRHHDRRCAYVEVEACVGRKKIGHEEANRAHDYLKKVGHPKNFGLWECGIILRRTGAEWVYELQKNWWRHMFSADVWRDQLWLPVAMREAKIPAGRFKTIEMNVRKNDFFTFRPHA